MGAFVVVGGIDASGKTTQAELLVGALRALGVKARMTAEPWVSPHGWKIREMLSLDARPDTMEMALLFAADRRAHVRKIRDWMMEDREVVVSTRYVESSIAYQGSQLAAEGMADGFAWVGALNRHFQHPSVYVILDVPSDVAASRLLRRSGDKTDVYERDLALQQAVASVYSNLERHLPEDHIVHIDGLNPPEAVHAAVLRTVLGVL